MRSIYKYNIMDATNGIIEGPITKILTAQMQHNAIVVWAEVDTEKPNRKFQILPIGTGWPLDPQPGKSCILDTHKYIGTVQAAGGSLIFHIYAAELSQTSVKNKQPGEMKLKADAIKVNADQGKEATFTGTAVINPEVLKQFVH